MKILISIISVICLIRTSYGSPFALTDEYIESFKQGIEEMKKLAEQTQFQEGSFNPALYNETESLKEAKEYDFIIIGGGTSGAVLANRLTEVPEWKVLLLESGGPETGITQIPSMASTLQKTPYTWGYTTTPQESWCLGMIDHKCSISTGKALGGTSAINEMIYTRGNPKDYDIWSDLGNEGWCYRDVLPYFLKSENAYLHNFDRKFHKQGGPVQVEDPQYQTPLAEKFYEASKELGYKPVDYNGKEQLGYGVPQATTKNGRRNSASQAYLAPAKSRKNLLIKPKSQVIKIIISPHTKEAYGVKYIHEGQLYIAKAAKEVIVAAGAINTPQLLLLSGIGPKEELEKLGIDAVKDLKVGENLKDHIAFLGVNYFLNETQGEQNDLKDELVAYLKSGKGPMTGIGIEGLNFVKTEVSKDKTDYPDVELIFLPYTYNKGYETVKYLRFTPDTYTSVWKPIEGKKGFTIAVSQAQPKSKGVVKLKSKDPLNYPLIDSKQLTDPEEIDISTVLAGIKKAVEYGKTETFKKIGAQLNPHQVHGCEQYEFGTDPYWKCAVRFLSVSLKDPSGTAKMGPETDKEAVVDNKLKVYGIHKLRVADSSVIPASITGDLYAPTVMIGEKAADLIKEEWK